MKIEVSGNQITLLTLTTKTPTKPEAPTSADSLGEWAPLVRIATPEEPYAWACLYDGSAFGVGAIPYMINNG